jgi:hypothetical protein
MIEPVLIRALLQHCDVNISIDLNILEFIVMPLYVSTKRPVVEKTNEGDDIILIALKLC